jgi:outer membrane protein OmpA-like peptidoglycan-associated protein
MKSKQSIYKSILACSLAFIMASCAGVPKIEDPFREFNTGIPPAMILKNHYTFSYETAQCGDTQQFLVTDRPFSIIPPDKSLKLDFEAFTSPVSEPDPDKSFSVFFSVGASTIDENESQKISQFIEELKQDQAGPVDVTGYTCWLGSDVYNQKLAEKRAQAIADILKKQNIRIGFVTGKSGCCYTSDTNPAQNRRVDIMVSHETEIPITENPEGGDLEISE